MDCLDTCLDVCKTTGLPVEYFCANLLLEILICDTNFQGENLIMDQLWSMIKIRNIRLICLKILMVTIWIPVWMYAK